MPPLSWFQLVAQQIIHSRAYPLPDRPSLGVASGHQFVGPLGCMDRGILAMLANDQIGCPPDVGISDNHRALSFQPPDDAQHVDGGEGCIERHQGPITHD